MISEIILIPLPNRAVLKELVKYIPLPGMKELYKMVVMAIYKTQQGGNYSERKGSSPTDRAT